MSYNHSIPARPMSQARPAGGQPFPTAVARRRFRFFGSVLWALLPLLSFGFATPAVFIHRAVRLTSAMSIFSAVFYSAALVYVWAVTFAYAPEDDSTLFDTVLLGFVIVWIGATIHACLVRTAAKEAASAGPQRGGGWFPHAHQSSSQPTQSGPHSRPAGEPSPLQHVQQRQQHRRNARSLIAADPMLAKELGYGRPSVRGSSDDGGLVDFNHASVEEMAQLPGVEQAVAQEIRDRVRHVGPFSSLGEVMLEIDIDPTYLPQLEEYVVFIP
ncbi:ComEA family DNA-binding protein [Natronoglycomyces albus]|uniref:Helix-hairpin-helix domain-containing protein n=1 Tax=Natronoglycomyces albus TaxID=2811108 RepID=A0A895XPM3_9ACTN|nr:helix-hairpin-helix domain-containing protein [Natronoglycomyces albus]QSB05692.1 helix-hairpin-helix domain-containing protein [Natronoglycomyces albus]